MRGRTLALIAAAIAVILVAIAVTAALYVRSLPPTVQKPPGYNPGGPFVPAP